MGLFAFIAIALGQQAPGLLAAEPPDPLPLAVSGDRSAAIAWSRHFSSAGDDWINDLVSLADGTVMAVGFLNRRDGSPPSDWLALAAQLATDGRLVSQQVYGQGSGIDAFWSMAEAPNKRRVIAGFTTRIGAGGIDALVLLTEPTGAFRGEQAFGESGYDRFTDVASTGDGFVFLGHSQPAGEDRRRIFVVKIDPEGKPLWQRIHDAPESWGALYIEPVGDGGFIIAGGTELGGDSDMFAMKVDGEGRELWRKRVGTADWDEVNHGLVVRRDGRIVLAGYTHRRGEEVNDFVAATLSPSGEVERIERLAGAGDDRAILAKPDAKGRVWIVGHSASAGAGGVDLLLARLDAEGRFEAPAITIGSPSDDHGTALLPLGDGSLLLAGYSRGLGGGGQDAFVLRLTAPAWDQPNAAYRREVAKP
jgi:hypothetical protein